MIDGAIVDIAVTDGVISSITGARDPKADAASSAHSIDAQQPPGESPQFSLHSDALNS